MSCKLLDRKETIIVEESILKDGFICFNKYVNGVLEAQHFKPEDPMKTHPTAYRPKDLRFCYYGEGAFTKLNKVVNRADTYQDKLLYPQQIFVDVNVFSSYDKLYCNWLGMNGEIYKITQRDPIPLWKDKDYIGGYTNEYYDLKKCLAHLKTISWVRKASIEEIPYYNKSKYCTHGLRFEYKFPAEVYAAQTKGELDHELKQRDVFGLEQFNIEPNPNRYYEEDDEDEEDDY